MQEWFICQVSKTLGVIFIHESSNLSPTALISFVQYLTVNLMLSKKGFSLFILVSVLLLLFVAIYVSFPAFNKYHGNGFNPSTEIGNEANTSPVQRFTSSSDLVSIYEELKNQNRIKECHFFDNCYQDIFNADVRLQVARKYEIANSASDNKDVRIGLLKGSSVDIPGIGTGYLENKNKLNLQPDTWYWEIGTCSTNNRIFVDAATGQPGLLHKFTYCSRLL